MLTVHYASGHLDRAMKLREDDDWVSAAFVSDAALAVLIHNHRNLVRGLDGRVGGPRAAAIPMSVVRDRLRPDRLTWAFLGLDGDVPVFGVDLGTTQPDNAPEIADAGEFVDLRRAGPLVPPSDAAMMAYARAVLAWHRRHRYCGTCGSPTESRRAGHVRRCCDPACGTEVFPRTDPAVIMLVTRPATATSPARCLLGRHSRLPRGAYSLLAGFVEPGESLEEAVAREVWEEAGVRVRDAHYQASQPWPFPHSMMMGFRAQADDDAITIDTDELEDARWFTAAEVAAFAEWEHDAAQFRRPRRDSIARVLLDAWVDEETSRR